MGRKKTGKNIFCENCGKLRYFTKQQIRKNNHFYCSEKCLNKKRPKPWNKGLTKETDIRLKNISEKSKQQMFREYASGMRDKNKIIEKAHQAVRKKGLERFKREPRRYVSKRGYWIIYVPGIGDIKEHHHIWKKQFGEIPQGYHLHHINLNRLDNRIENLQLIPKKEHAKLHDKLRKRNKKGQYIKEGEE